jgi:hypothetical protein
VVLAPLELGLIIKESKFDAATRKLTGELVANDIVCRVISVPGMLFAIEAMMTGTDPIADQ